MAEEPSKELISDKPTSNVSNHDGWRSQVDQLRLPDLLGRYPARPVWAAFLFVNGFLTIGLLASFAMISGTPLIFPSLGPTAVLLFRNPMEPTACPRNTLCGHAIGIFCGYASLWLMGLTRAPTIMEGVLAERVICAALSLAATGALMVLLDVWHPPAGSTTLIIALGIIVRPYHLLIVEAAVAILVLQALIINRLAGVKYPVWAASERIEPAEPFAAERH